MPAYTSRLNLYKPGDGVNISPDEAADIDKLNDNADLIDDAVGAKVVTSGTRPAGPYTGQVIYETDTKRPVVWNGSAWLGLAGTLEDRVTTRVADFTALAAVSTTNMLSGDLAYVTEGAVTMQWQGSAPWVQVTTATFADVAARDTAYAKAAGAYLVAGVEALIGSVTYRYTTAWRVLLQSDVMRPSSVTGGTIASDGSFTSSAAAPVRANGVFTTLYPRFEVAFDVSTSSNTTLGMVLSASGVDTESGYDNERLLMTTAASGAQSINAAALILSGGANSTRFVGSAFFDTNPAVAAATYFRVSVTVSPNPLTTSHGGYLGFGLQRSSVAFDGFRFTVGAGTITVNRCSVIGLL